MAFITHKLVSIVAVCLLASGIAVYSFSNLAAGEDRDGDKQQVSVTAGNSPQQNSATATIVDNGSRPAGNPAVVMGRSRQAVEKIGAKLDSDLEMDFTQESLSGVADFLSKKLQIPIVIDRKSLEEQGLSDDKIKITLTLKDVSARSALHLMLDAHDLDYVIANEVLLITTMEQAEALHDTRVYLTEDLAIDPDALISVITGSLSPDSWEDVGGAGAIHALDEPTQRLVISQTSRIHGRIKDLLDQLRRTSPAGAIRKTRKQFKARKGTGGGFLGGFSKPAAGSKKPAAGPNKPTRASDKSSNGAR